MSENLDDDYEVDNDITDFDLLDDDELRRRYLAARLKKISAEAKIKQESYGIEKIKKEKLLGTLISLKEAEEAFNILGSRTKTNLMRLIGELPPKLEGLTASKMVPIIRKLVDDILENLAASQTVEVKEVSTTELEILNDTKDEQ